jgi:peptide-methionine (S)-S-oxide reductase
VYRAVRIEFDPARVSYAQLLEKFWPTIDPTVKDQQFCDIGSQYRSGIFVLNEAAQGRGFRQRCRSRSRFNPS